MDILISIFFGGLFYAIVAAVQMAPISVPLILIFFAHLKWREYLLTKWLASKKWSTIEIRLPREVFKSPAAMEVVLNAFNQPSAGSKYDQRFKGRVRLWSSLEFVAIGGKVRFIVHLPSDFRNGVEAQFYAQYPGVEIREIEDYTNGVDYLSPNTEWEIAGWQFKKALKDFYPIKTYFDFGIGPDKNIKEEVKTDPITATLEALGSLPADHQIWFQILIMSAKTDDKKVPLWKKEADAYIEKVYEPVEKFKLVAPTDRESTEAITRAVSKPAFDVGIRGLYLAKKDKFNAGLGATVPGLLKQYGTIHLNSFVPKGTGKDEPYQDPFGKIDQRNKRRIFDAYRRRSWFYPPHEYVPFTMNVEELATIWHLPGSVAATPALDRIDSKSSEPPMNLPFE